MATANRGGWIQLPSGRSVRAPKPTADEAALKARIISARYNKAKSERACEVARDALRRSMRGGPPLTRGERRSLAQHVPKEVFEEEKLTRCDQVVETQRDTS